MRMPWEINAACCLFSATLAAMFLWYGHPAAAGLNALAALLNLVIVIWVRR